MKRLFSFALGIGLGAAAAVILARALRRARARLPEVIVEETGKAVKSVQAALRSAVEEGRKAMRETERELEAGG
ncbi:MAG: hypothetical protein ACREJP_09170 [Candidatus Methylomirabilales bacterium]